MVMEVAFSKSISGPGKRLLLELLEQHHVCRTLVDCVVRQFINNDSAVWHLPQCAYAHLYSFAKIR